MLHEGPVNQVIAEVKDSGFSLFVFNQKPPLIENLTRTLKDWPFFLASRELPCLGKLSVRRFFSNVLSSLLPVSVDAQEVKDSVKCPDYIERLARKYMVRF